MEQVTVEQVDVQPVENKAHSEESLEMKERVNAILYGSIDTLSSALTHAENVLEPYFTNNGEPTGYDMTSDAEEAYMLTYCFQNGEDADGNSLQQGQDDD